jgi:hypothetical protein
VISNTSNRLGKLGRSIQQELDYVQGKQSNRGMIRRYVEATEDSDDVLACYRRIQGHLQRLSVGYTASQTVQEVLMIIKANANLTIWKTVDEMATVCFTMSSAAVV